ncbi:hypothetical protein ES754_08725 [Psychrobacter frigidicola]|uniref:Uncharacterized protein n=1 Tax=Psychrobacter frigidicola TaxID=45611 RepID=A0A5C7A5L3_9GAMM|nr:hypothetical protein [Psychrobacter frigidicola]TXD97083.1 hypothetical protein ES754_08725 [Psychrobacter frigidicola]
MSEFWQELIINLGGNAVLGGLIIYLGKIYLERIGRNEQAAIDGRLRSLEQDHEKLLSRGEHFHQISQKAYTNFFTAKMDAYIKLANLRYDYVSAIDNFVPDPFDVTERVNKFQAKIVLKIRNHIQKNRIYWSDDLLVNFDEWNKKFTLEKSSGEYDRRQRWSHFSALAREMEESAQLLADNELYDDILRFMEENTENWDKLLNNIDSDILSLRKKYNL